MNFFSPPPPAPPLPPDQVAATYEHWRWRHLYACFIGYAVFYFVRSNIPTAMPLLITDLGIKQADLGMFLSLHGIVYGFSKFICGMLGDRSNPRYFMATGLLLSAMANLAFGFSSSVMVLGMCWVFNGWFQGMGFPPCARLLAHWFTKEERGRKWAIWNASHQVGGFGISILAIYLGEHYGWRAIFTVPAIIALATTLFLINRLRDTPESLGLPSVEVYTGAETAENRHHDTGHEPLPIGGILETEPPKEATESFGHVLVHRVFSNPYIWLICFANFFVYIIRLGFFNWAITYLSTEKQYPLGSLIMMNASFEMAGLVGSLLAGWLTDRLFRGRRTPVCLIYLVGTAVAIYSMWKAPDGNLTWNLCSLAMVGFFIYGPQFLVGVMVTDLASKEAAATAIGLTGFFGYISGIVSGWGVGTLVDSYHSWDPVFILMLGCCLGAAIPFAMCWKKC